MAKEWWCKTSKWEKYREKTTPRHREPKTCSNLWLYIFFVVSHFVAIMICIATVKFDIILTELECRHGCVGMVSLDSAKTIENRQLLCMAENFV